MKLGHKADATCHSHVEIAGVRVLLKDSTKQRLNAHSAQKLRAFPDSKDTVQMDISALV